MATAEPRGQPHDRQRKHVFPAGNGALDEPSSPKITPPSNQIETSIAQKMLSAVSGSVLTSLLVTPLDVVRVRLQTHSSQPPSTNLPFFLEGKLPPNLGISACCREVFWVQNQSQFCVANAAPAAPSAGVMDEMIISDCAAEAMQRRSFNSTFDGLRKIARNEGIFTLWRGLSPTLLMAIPANVIYFAGYDWLRTNQKSPMKDRVSDTYAPLVAGSLARVVAAVAVSPVEMLRTRMQASSSTEKGVMRATVTGLREMVSNEGYRSLWRGLTLTLWRDVPFSALYWWGYEYGRKRLAETRHQTAVMAGSPSKKELSHSALLVDSFIAGAGAGAVAAYVTTPFDVGKTRQQTVLRDPKAISKHLPENQSIPRFLWHIYCKEGATGLFKGWAARCLKVAPACAIMISTYEIGKKMAIDVNEKRDAREEA